METPNSECVERSIDIVVSMPAIVAVVLGQLEALVELDQRQVVGQVAVDLVGRAEDERRVGRVRRAWPASRFSVPFALTVKSVCGSDAAQSCDGWAAVWITSSIEPAVPARTARSTASRSRMSSSQRAERAAERARQSLGGVRGRGARGRRTARACRSRCRPRRSRPARSAAADSEPIRPPEPVTIAVGISRAVKHEAGRLRVSERRAHQRQPTAPRVLRSRRGCRRGSRAGDAPGPPVGQPEQPPAVGDVDGHIARAGLAARSRSRSSLPVISRAQRSWSRAATGCTSRPPPTLTVDAVPAVRARRSARRAGRPGPRRGAGRAPACRGRRSRCSAAGAGSGGRASSR